MNKKLCISIMLALVMLCGCKFVNHEDEERAYQNSPEIDIGEVVGVISSGSEGWHSNYTATTYDTTKVVVKRVSDGNGISCSQDIALIKGDKLVAKGSYGGMDRSDMHKVMINDVADCAGWIILLKYDK